MRRIECDESVQWIPAVAASAGNVLEDIEAGLDQFEAVSAQGSQFGFAALRGLAPWLLALSVATVPITYYNPIADVRRSGAVSALQALRARRGRRVSLAQARTIALRIMAETEARLQEERLAESRFLLAFDEDAAAVSA